MHQQATVEAEVGPAQFTAVGHLVGNGRVLAIQYHTGLDALAEGGELTSHGLGAGKAWSADDGQVFRHAAQGRQAQLATGDRVVAADHIIDRIGRGGAFFDDDHIDRHLDHLEDLVHRLEQGARLSAGRVQQRLGGEAVDAKRRVFRD